jgi:hypothetical protein
VRQEIPRTWYYIGEGMLYEKNRPTPDDEGSESHRGLTILNTTYEEPEKTIRGG